MTGGSKGIGLSRVVLGRSYALLEGARAGWRIEALALEGDQHMQRPRARCILGTGEADDRCWGSGNRKLHEKAGGGGRDQDSRALSFTGRSLDSLLRPGGAMERLWAMKCHDLIWLEFYSILQSLNGEWIQGAWRLEWQTEDPRQGHCPHPGERDDSGLGRGSGGREGEVMDLRRGFQVKSPGLVTVATAQFWSLNSPFQFFWITVPIHSKQKVETT